ncbi:MAG: threonine synthase [Acidobacteria bacterium]|nr:threonine synthase [Acidobacteriota bacterium]MBU1474615.1 threonine synthase [Acidobacteriota bacterium]
MDVDRFSESFVCSDCRHETPADVFHTFCNRCSEPLLLEFRSNNPIFQWKKGLFLERFHDFLPIENARLWADPGTGDTPLVSLPAIADKYGLPPLYAKMESAEPTGSFKDRGTAVAVQKALELGISAIGTVSTGNMAASTAAYGARAGLKTVILVKEDTAEDKIKAAGIYGADMIRVRGDYGALFRKSLELGRKHGIWFMNSVDPYRIEGYKTLSFELYDDLSEKPPDYLCVPVSAGGHLTGLIKGFEELREMGLTEVLPRMIGVQAAGCSPIVQAFERGDSHVTRIEKPDTIAHAISNPDPPAGSLVLKKMKEHEGEMTAVTDEQILQAQQELAALEGIFCQPASATTLAGWIQFTRSHPVERRSRCVLVITGSGLKTVGQVDSCALSIRDSDLTDLDSLLSSIKKGHP